MHINYKDMYTITKTFNGDLDVLPKTFSTIFFKGNSPAFEVL